MAGDPARKHATYDDVLAASEDRVAEPVHGSRYVQPRPRLRHARAASALLVLLASACAATPLSRHAREHERRGEPSTLSAETRTLLEASLGPRPTRMLVARRLDLLRAEPTSLTSDESLALVQSTLDWVELVAHGWSPDWVGNGCAETGFVASRATSCAPAEACDVIGELDGTSARVSVPAECVARAIRGTWALVERAARGPDAIILWREAMTELHGSGETCSPDGEEGAVAVAILAEVSAFRTAIAADETVVLASPDFACTTVGLDGTITLDRATTTRSGAMFVRSCWARGGPTDRACVDLDATPRARATPAPAVTHDEAPTTATTTHQFDFGWSDDDWTGPDDDVVMVLIGSTAQAFRLFVVRRDGVWRVIDRRLAWTT